ncbi:MAG: CoB--CoM heterodisulfide reductase subunit C [Methanobrevibacter arboriphilus]|uniref:CoB--CoM heterodisulfide reductase subunit C n=1 Tax=Methanobrevibacter arboriphilus TaxID=39441 RepID=A0A843AGK2_METAZ|nr:CoB--CoM heterodisulfide reductase subunit C [Methanobrevibacter arboriphilus]MBF4468236.1 CoB--CoM heterodisulfide reductase subunit C [Methanobrevibacter arboriphilus]
MSVFKRLKALVTGSNDDVVENNSEDKVLDRKKSGEPSDLRPEQTNSNTKEEKEALSSTNENSQDVSKKDDNTKSTEAENTKIEVVEVETPTLTSKNKSKNKPSETKEKIEKKVEEVKEDIKEVADEVKNSIEDTIENADKVKSVDEKADDSKDEDTEDHSDNDSKNKEEKRDTMTLLNEEEKLTLGNVDPEFTQIFKDAGIDSVEICFQCGTCTGGCPSGRRTPYRVRQLVRKCLIGLKDEVISDDSLWMCSTCYTCQERCPREIKIVEIVKMARNVAAQNGFMAPAHKATGSFVIKTGHGVPINDATRELRKRVGLDELPPTTHSHPEALEEVQKICEITGFDDLIGFNKATGELE